MYKALGVFGAGEIAVSILAQADIVPDNLISIFAQLPLVAVIVWLWLQTDKRQREDKEKDRLWLEHMLETQRSSIKETYRSRDDLMSALVGQIEKKQSDMMNEVKFLSQQMADEIKLLNQQIAINTATVNEIAKVDSVVSDLIDRLEKK